jgi:PadR family transcriptional regulator
MGAPVTDSVDILRGTLDLLVLKALTCGPSHGYDVARWIEWATGDVLNVGEGTLYPALHRLQGRGWVHSLWGVSENGRRARYYELTPAGRAQMRVERANWTRYANAVFAALDMPAKPAPA